MQIVQELQTLGTKDVACVIDAKHLCVNSRESVILKVALSLLNSVENLKTLKLEEFLDYIKLETKF
jgi:GTP cyclohydrolase I